MLMHLPGSFPSIILIKYTVQISDQNSPNHSIRILIYDSIHLYPNSKKKKRYKRKCWYIKYNIQYYLHIFLCFKWARSQQYISLLVHFKWKCLIYSLEYSFARPMQMSLSCILFLFLCLHNLYMHVHTQNLNFLRCCVCTCIVQILSLYAKYVHRI